MGVFLFVWCRKYKAKMVLRVAQKEYQPSFFLIPQSRQNRASNTERLPV